MLSLPKYPTQLSYCRFFSRASSFIVLRSKHRTSNFITVYSMFTHVTCNHKVTQALSRNNCLHGFKPGMTQAGMLSQRY